MAKNTTQTGQKAERAAAVYLEMRGYKVLEQNWRRPKCEIDIIAKNGKTVFFVEVKYRRDYGQGGGLEAITASKLKQMQYAAQMWVEETEWAGNYQLAAIEIAGKEFAVMSFVDNVF